MNTSDKIERLKKELAAAKEGTPEYNSLYKSLEYYNSSSASENQLKSAMDAANSNNIKTPYFKNLENDFGITDIEGQEYILGRVFKYSSPIADDNIQNIKGNADSLDTIRIIKDSDVYEVVDKSDDNILYREYPSGSWEMFEYDVYEQQRFYQNSNGEIDDDRDTSPPYTYNANDQYEVQRQVKSNRDIYPPFNIDNMMKTSGNSSLNESTEVKKIKDLMKRINIIK